MKTAAKQEFERWQHGYIGRLRYFAETFANAVAGADAEVETAIKSGANKETVQYVTRVARAVRRAHAQALETVEFITNEDNKLEDVWMREDEAAARWRDVVRFLGRFEGVCERCLQERTQGAPAGGGKNGD
jgi:hypothetical protein